MAVNDIKAVVVRDDGWSVDVTIEGWSAEVADIAYDYGDPDNAAGNVAFTVVSEGYNSSGVLGTITRTVYGTETVRKPVPNQAELDETVSGADVVIRISLSEGIFDDDRNGGAGTSGTDPTVTFAAGWARHSGTTDSNAATDFPVTNNSTLDYPKVIGQWDWANTPAWKRVESNFDMAFRARHGHGVSVVALTATGAISGNNPGQVVTALSATQHQNGMYSESYKFTGIPIAGFTQGENIVLRAVAFPVVGDENSVLNTDANTTFSDDPKGLTQITCTCDKTGALKQYATVTTTGDDGAGVVSSDPATADATPFLTPAAAIRGGATVVRVRTGTHQIMGGRGAGTLDYYVEVRPHPSDDPAGITLNRSEVSNNRQTRTRFLAFIGFTGEIATTAGNQYFDGELADRRILFEDCNFNTVVSQTIPIGYRLVGMWFVNCTGLGNDDYGIFGANPSIYLMTGCSFTANPTSPVVSGTFIANDHTHAAGDIRVASNPSTTVPGASATDNVMWEHNLLTSLEPLNNVFAFANDVSGSNASLLGNILECTALDRAQWLIAGDGFTAPLEHLILAHNTSVGNRGNLFYNDEGSLPAVRTNVFMVGNAFENYAIKSDDFAAQPDGGRVGNWAQMYGVNHKDNRLDGVVSLSFMPEYHGLNVEYVLAADFVLGDIGYADNAGKNGSGLGNGDYTPVGEQLLGKNTTLSYLSFDQQGNPFNSDVGAVQTGAAPQPPSAAASLTDVRFNTLRALGYSGSISDMTLLWLQDGGPATGPVTGPLKTIPDAWRSVLEQLESEDANFNPTGSYHRSDWWFEYLGSLGYSGQMNDRELGYWLALYNSTTGNAYSDDFGIGFG